MVKKIRIVDIGIFPNTGAVWVEYEFEFEGGIRETSSMTLWPKASEAEIDHELLNKYKTSQRKRAEPSVDYTKLKNKTIPTE